LYRYPLRNDPLQCGPAEEERGMSIRVYSYILAFFEKYYQE
jgi:hypothetical protein